MAPHNLPPFDEDGSLNVIIETPKGSRNKFKWEEDKGLYSLAGVLPQGAYFPFDFGFVPSTQAEDGDPIDVLVLMDEPAFVGCLVHCRLIGVIRAQQTERDGESDRNDRLIAVAEKSSEHKEIETLKDLPDNLAGELEHFFESYNEAKGKQFKPLGKRGPAEAKKLVERAAERRQKK